MNNLIEQLRGGDRRSIGRADEVVRFVLESPAEFNTLIEGLLHENDVVRMRCADAIEKIAHTRSDLLKPHTRFLLGKIATNPQQEVRWHLAQVMPRLELGPRELRRAVTILKIYLKDKSGIVRVSAMQALADLSVENSLLRKQVRPLIRELAEHGTPAMKARGRKLLMQLNKEEKQ